MYRCSKQTCLNGIKIIWQYITDITDNISSEIQHNEGKDNIA